MKKQLKHLVLTLTFLLIGVVTLNAQQTCACHESTADNMSCQTVNHCDLNHHCDQHCNALLNADIFNLMLKNSSLNAESSETYLAYGSNIVCTLCHGSKKCTWCHNGKVNGTKICNYCKGTNICPRCKGAGVIVKFGGPAHIL